jgi:hypothetical protein
MYGVRLRDGNNWHDHGLHHRPGRVINNERHILMKYEIKQTLIQHYESQIRVHMLNVEIMMNNPTAIQEHQDLVSAIDIELGHAAEAQHKLEILKRELK